MKLKAFELHIYLLVGWHGYLQPVRGGQGCPAASSRGTSAGRGSAERGKWDGCAAGQRRDRLTRCSPLSLPRSLHWGAGAEDTDDMRGSLILPMHSLWLKPTLSNIVRHPLLLLMRAITKAQRTSNIFATWKSTLQLKVKLTWQVEHPSGCGFWWSFYSDPVKNQPMCSAFQ